MKLKLSKIISDTLSWKYSSLGIYEQRLIWLIRLRLIALFSQLPLTIIGRYYGYLNQSSHVIFTFALVILIAFNAHLYRCITQEKKKSSELSITLHIIFDLICFTLLLSISGDTNNPFYAFFYVMAVLGGIFSSGNSSYLFVANLILCISFIQLFPLLSGIQTQLIFLPKTTPYLLSQLLIPLVTFFIARSFGELLKKNHERLIAMTVHAERLDRLRALGSLSAGFSHEFASPLQNAKLRINRIIRSQKWSEEDAIECSQSIQDCEVVLKKMNFSQINLSIDGFEIINLKDTIREISTEWKMSNFNRNILIKTDNDAKVKVNKLNFAQALFNLLDNAAEASSEEKDIEIAISKNEDNKIKISIMDYGEGFDKNVIYRIGEPFNTSKEEGTGLGLYSTILFMNSVGGELKILQREPYGSIVELTFNNVS